MLGMGEKRGNSILKFKLVELPPLELILRGAVSPSKSPSSLLSESNASRVDNET
jgi:hypothetical protein